MHTNKRARRPAECVASVLIGSLELFNWFCHEFNGISLQCQWRKKKKKKNFHGRLKEERGGADERSGGAESTKKSNKKKKKKKNNY